MDYLLFSSLYRTSQWAPYYNNSHWCLLSSYYIAATCHVNICTQSVLCLTLHELSSLTQSKHWIGGCFKVHQKYIKWLILLTDKHFLNFSTAWGLTSRCFWKPRSMTACYASRNVFIKKLKQRTRQLPQVLHCYHVWSPFPLPLHTQIQYMYINTCK
jgi:hypothetical protein